MITSGSFGFISYNSRDFLVDVLQSFIDDGIFLRCACWYHESTGKDKNHFHCYVEPTKQIDTSTISEKFIERDVQTDTQQSIAILPRCKSKFTDAYLYGIHNSDYLAYKGKVREVVNIKSDMHIYLGDFSADIAEAEFYLLKFCLAPYVRLKQLVLQGKTLEDVYILLRTPFGQLNAVRQAYYSILQNLRVEKNIEEKIENGVLTEDNEQTELPF